MNKRRFAYLLLVSAVFAYSLPAGAEEIPGTEVEISRIAAAGTEAENAGFEEIETEAEAAGAAGAAAAGTEIDDAEQSVDGGYDYTPEEILYLTGVRECAFRDGLSYTLCSPDGEESPLLLIRQEDETGRPLLLYRYEENTKSAARAETLTGSGLEAFMKDPENHWDELLWVDSGQWPDGTIVGVAQQTGNPGEENDFYLSANYDWLKETRIHSQGEISSPTADLEETVSRNKRRMLEDRETYQGEDIRRVRAYLDLATDWEKRNAEGVEPVRKYLDSFHEISSLPELTGYLTDPEENPFCRMADLSVTLDLKDTADWIVQIREDSFSILPRDFQRLPEEEIEETRSDFESQAGHVLRRAGYPDEEVQRILRECYGMEDQLLPCAWPQEGEEEEPDLILPFDEAVKFCSNFPLGQLLEACGVNSGRVSIVYPAYLRKLDELYTEENLSMLRSYLIAHTARDACAYLDLEAMKICNGYEENGELSEEAFTEQLNEGYAGEVLSPRELMGVAEENAYMTYFVDPDVRAELTELTKEIRDTFREILDCLLRGEFNAVLRGAPEMQVFAAGQGVCLFILHIQLIRLFQVGDHPRRAVFLKAVVCHIVIFNHGNEAFCLPAPGLPGDRIQGRAAFMHLPVLFLRQIPHNRNLLPAVVRHDGVHRFYVGPGAKIRYVEKHYGSGDGKGKRILNPVTEVYMEENSTMEMEMVQIKGVDASKNAWLSTALPP